LLTPLTVKWSRHLSQIESVLQAHDVAKLPALSTISERELDRIVSALSEAGHRLADARQRAEQLARQVAMESAASPQASQDEALSARHVRSPDGECWRSRHRTALGECGNSRDFAIFGFAT
jgi:hypothetical protein